MRMARRSMCTESACPCAQPRSTHSTALLIVAREELLDYEAYEEHVVPRLADIAAEMRSRWPDLGRVVLIHRIGPVDIGVHGAALACFSSV